LKPFPIISGLPPVAEGTLFYPLQRITLQGLTFRAETSIVIPTLMMMMTVVLDHYGQGFQFTLKTA
jgi:hypothetical protein